MEQQNQGKIYTCGSYAPTFKDGLQGVKEKFCDAKLVAGGTIFKGHKIILAANSRYFHSIFVENFTERESDEIKLPPQIDAVAMHTILNYFYSGELKLSKENIESVFRATDYMRLDPLLEICNEYMQETQDLSNCVRRFIMTEMIEYSSSRLESFKKSASTLIVEESVNVSTTEDFLSLSMKHISKIVKWNSHPDRVQSLYAIIMNWVGHDNENRRQYLCDLLQMLPVSGFSSEFYNKMKADELLRSDFQGVLWLLDNSILQNPALAYLNQPNLLFLADRSEATNCFVVNVQNRAPKETPQRPKLFRFYTVCHKKRIFLLSAGRKGKFHRLDGPETTWTKCELNFNIACFGAGHVVLGDDLYMFGGRDSTSFHDLDSCMKFNFSLNRKEDLPAMRKTRAYPGAAVYSNSIYVACGQFMSSASPSIDRFDPREGRWCEVGRYETEITTCSSTADADYLYATDENSGKVARFDFRANRSQEICSLPSLFDRRNSISCVEGNLFGAVNSDIFKYEAAIDKWNIFCPGPIMFFEEPIIVPWM